MSEKRRKARQDSEGEADLGDLGGVFKGVGGLFDLVSKMVEQGKEVETRSGEKDILGGKGKAVYGFSVRVGLGGKPVIDSFGNVRTTQAGPVVAEMREPLVDVFDEDSEIRVVAEIPGAAEKEILVEIKDDILTLTAEAGDRKYHKELLLPSAVEPKAQKQSYRNGILELKLRKLAP